MLRPVGVLLVFHTLLQCLILGLQAAVDDTIEKLMRPKLLSPLERLSVAPPPPESVVSPRRSVLPPSDR